jgi:hypothetical protein
MMQVLRRAAPAQLVKSTDLATKVDYEVNEAVTDRLNSFHHWKVTGSQRQWSTTIMPLAWSGTDGMTKQIVG